MIPSETDLPGETGHALHLATATTPAEIDLQDADPDREPHQEESVPRLRVLDLRHEQEAHADSHRVETKSVGPEPHQEEMRGDDQDHHLSVSVPGSGLGRLFEDLLQLVPEAGMCDHVREARIAEMIESLQAAKMDLARRPIASDHHQLSLRIEEETRIGQLPESAHQDAQQLQDPLPEDPLVFDLLLLVQVEQVEAETLLHLYRLYQIKTRHLITRPQSYRLPALVDSTSWGAAPPQRQTPDVVPRITTPAPRPTPTPSPVISSAPSVPTIVPTGPAAGIPTGPRAGVPTRPNLQHSSSIYNRNPSISNASGGPRLHPALNNMPQIIPGGRIDPTSTGFTAETAIHLKKLEEEEEILRAKLYAKEERLNQSMRQWDRLSRESAACSLRSEYSERHVRQLAGESVGGAAF
ncbi:unnamed protein product [Diplocarpon coronariae]